MDGDAEGVSVVSESAVAGRIVSDAKYQAIQMVRDPTRACDVCGQKKWPSAYASARDSTCRKCTSTAPVKPSCHPMLLVKW